MADLQKKGGAADGIVGRKCLCNGLLANVGLGNVMKLGGRELPLVTAGDDINHIRRFLTPHATPGSEEDGYSALDVLTYLRSALPVSN